MLKIIRAWNDLNFRQLMQVYAQSNAELGRINYPDFSVERALLEAEQDQYEYLYDFFRKYHGICAVWDVDNCYVSALRCEKFRDGFLIEGLETQSEKRCMGYGKQLLKLFIEYMQEQRNIPIYSHIDKNNISSQKVHEACGFVKILDYAVYIDGSVDSVCDTYRYG